MTVTITRPSNGEKFALNIKVVFQGTADDGVVSVKLIADSKFLLGEAAVVAEKWSIPYEFNTPGASRRITAQGFDASGNLLTEAKVEIGIEASIVSCASKVRLFKIGDRSVWQLPGQSAFFYQSGMSIDADGAPKAYHPDDIGIDFLDNAGKSGNWWALVTDNGQPSGNPLIQKSADPAPGFFISMTALGDKTKAKTNPRKYVDATKIPYIVLPGNRDIQKKTGAKLGDFAAVFNGSNGKLAFAIFADIGPQDELGEGSVALAQALGHDPFLNGKVRQGISKNLLYVVFPGSRNLTRSWSSEESEKDISSEAAKHFETWGGMNRIEACFKELSILG